MAWNVTAHPALRFTTLRFALCESRPLSIPGINVLTIDSLTTIKGPQPLINAGAKFREMRGAETVMLFE